MKKKAFTLTELLVVVVIIGVLAAVVLPKFLHVIEDRKTAEAENIMRAIRTEQEARCALDKDYAGATSELSSWPAHSGANYQYELLASGLHATKTDNAYQLFMGYRNGQICCQGSGCNALGKYASCDNAYLAQINDPSGECAAQNVGTAGIETPVIPEGCELTDEQIPCPEGYEGTAWKRVGSDCTYWEDYSGCSEKKDCSDGEKKDVESSCGTSKGKKCVNGKWENFEEAVDLTPEEKADCHCYEKPSQQRDCESGTGTQTLEYECDTATGQWKEGEWVGDCTCKPTHDGQETYTELCPDATEEDNLVIIYTWNPDTCSYDEDRGECICFPTNDRQDTYTAPCPEGKTGAITYTWDYVACKYKETDGCTNDCEISPECAAAAARGEHVRWDTTNCECICEDVVGIAWNGHACVMCINNPQEEIDLCHYGWDTHSQSGGIWDNKGCKCMCISNHSPRYTSQGWKYCEEDYGASGDKRECEEMGYPSYICDSLDPDDPNEPIDPYLWGEDPEDPWWDDDWGY